METIIETGAKFLLNPWKKHEPTLVSNEEKDRNKRIEFVKKKQWMLLNFWRLTL